MLQHTHAHTGCYEHGTQASVSTEQARNRRERERERPGERDGKEVGDSDGRVTGKVRVYRVPAPDVDGSSLIHEVVHGRVCAVGGAVDIQRLFRLSMSPRTQ